MDLKHYSIMRILENVKTDYEIILDLDEVLATLYGFNPKYENKEPYIHEFLRNKLSNTDISKSFHKKLLILYQEMLFPEILLSIHSWFFTRACNIENIVFLCTQSAGLKEWYQLYLNLHGIKGFTIIEAPFVSEQYKEWWLTDIPALDKKKLDKKVKYMFSYYGGRYRSPERDFLASALSTIPNSFVDYWADSSTDEQDEKEFENYLEQFTNFCDRSYIDQLLESRKNLEYIEGIRIFDETWKDTDTVIKKTDKISACSVIRETSNLLQYSTIGQKTLRSFMHLQFAIPISGHKSVEYLERLGFVFNHKLIDYSYQYEYSVYKRMKLLIKELNRLSTEYTLNDWQDIIHDNAELLCYNYNHFAEGTMLKVIKQNVIRSLNE